MKQITYPPFPPQDDNPKKDEKPDQGSIISEEPLSPDNSISNEEEDAEAESASDSEPSLGSMSFNQNPDHNLDLDQSYLSYKPRDFRRVAPCECCQWSPDWLAQV